MVDRRCRESKGKAKIEGYMSVSDEEAHHREADNDGCYCQNHDGEVWEYQSSHISIGWYSIIMSNQMLTNSGMNS